MLLLFHCFQIFYIFLVTSYHFFSFSKNCIIILFGCLSVCCFHYLHCLPWIYLCVFKFFLLTFYFFLFFCGCCWFFSLLFPLSFLVGFFIWFMCFQIFLLTFYHLTSFSQNCLIFCFWYVDFSLCCFHSLHCLASWFHFIYIFVCVFSNFSSHLLLFILLFSKVYYFFLWWLLLIFLSDVSTVFSCSSSISFFNFSPCHRYLLLFLLVPFSRPSCIGQQFLNWANKYKSVTGPLLITYDHGPVRFLGGLVTPNGWRIDDWRTRVTCTGRRVSDAGFEVLQGWTRRRRRLWQGRPLIYTHR